MKIDTNVTYFRYESLRIVSYSYETTCEILRTFDRYIYFIYLLKVTQDRSLSLSRHSKNTLYSSSAIHYVAPSINISYLKRHYRTDSRLPVAQLPVSRMFYFIRNDFSSDRAY
jgi:hypothetical protein